MVELQGGGHTALLVEDDLAMADEMRETLELLGYAVIHTTNLEDAKAIVDEGQFCFVVLDLEILRSRDATKARVEAGHALLSHIRNRYPGRNGRDERWLQVIVVSGHASQHPDVVRAMQLGASDLMVKPLSKNARKLGDHIVDALLRSGRRSHRQCREVARQAGATSSGSGLVLRITGPRKGRRTTAVADGHQVDLRDSSLGVILALVRARLEGDGWVHKRDLGASDEQGWQGIRRVTEDLRMTRVGDDKFYENDSQGSYRLRPSVQVDIEPTALASHPETRIVRLAAAIEALQGPAEVSGPDAT